jgi:hypothetical protein
MKCSLHDMCPYNTGVPTKQMFLHDRCPYICLNMKVYLHGRCSLKYRSHYQTGVPIRHVSLRIQMDVSISLLISQLIDLYIN